MDTLIVNADRAMYFAKKQGGNKVVVYNPDESNTDKERPHIEARLRKAILDETVEVFYQPKINAETGNIVGAEALARWKDKELGYVSPAVFIPISEETGLVQSLFELVMKKSMIQMNEWNKNRKEKITVSVNVSAKQFLEPLLLVESIQHALRDYHFPSEQLEIEITEGTLLNNISETVVALKELNKLGVTISVDDFGTGYSSLSYLRNLPINSLKIDQSFIKDIKEDGSNTEIPEAIINLARSLKLKI
jgi:EAL domain-containing protein (putative c-di-GMP-specific phosphodiesterase class I)